MSDTITRLDGDNCPLFVDMGTGGVSRRNTYYPAPLKTETARRVFLAWVGIVLSHEVPAFIRGCNRAAERKTLTADSQIADAAFQYAGIEPKSVKAAKPHGPNCPCPPCSVAHVKNGCRRINCPVCG